MPTRESVVKVTGDSNGIHLQTLSQSSAILYYCPNGVAVHDIASGRLLQQPFRIRGDTGWLVCVCARRPRQRCVDRWTGFSGVFVCVRNGRWCTLHPPLPRKDCPTCNGCRTYTAGLSVHSSNSCRVCFEVTPHARCVNCPSHSLLGC